MNKSNIAKIIFLTTFSTQLFSLTTAEKHMYQLKKLQNEKTQLINKYKIRIEVAKIDKMYKRVELLSKTLSCFENSRSRRDIMNCKTDERKRIMKRIRG